jgi:hypothetical protein
MIRQPDKQLLFISGLFILFSRTRTTFFVLILSPADAARIIVFVIRPPVVSATLFSLSGAGVTVCLKMKMAMFPMDTAY